ncbi:MAG: PucR family transcriptional regulator [Actinophytocola sp.]|nr:PucR family transcriptional regulator [Actinophytocola sp.]
MAERDPRQDVLGWVERFAATALRDDLLEELRSELIGVLVAEVPELTADAGIRHDLELSTHDLLRTFLDQAANDPAADMSFPPAAIDFARSLARRGHDVGLLLRLYRVGQRVFWSALMAIVRERVHDPDLRMRVLEFLWDRMSRVLERNIDVLVAAHSEESEQRLRGALVRRSETVQAILRGDSVDIETASRQLGHNLHRWQTALVLWDADSAEDADPSQDLETLASEAAKLLGAVRPLAIRSSARVVWVWLATGPDPEVRRVADAPILRRSPSLRVAVGVPAAGLAGFRESHREALRAQHVAAGAAHPATLTYYRDVEVVSCLSGDEEAMRALIARELGGLAGVGTACARLRQTVLAYLSAGGARAAAATLRVHKNTVLYRLKQAERLLGHGLDERRLELELALTVADVYGERVLPPASA